MSSDTEKRAPRDVDRSVGKRVRAARLQNNVSQMSLAETIGVTFQQVQKYELGKNRLSVSRLADIAMALNKPIDFFLPEASGGAASDVSSDAWSILSTDEGAKLIATFASIKSPLIRRKLLALAAVLATEDGAASD